MQVPFLLPFCPGYSSPDKTANKDFTLWSSLALEENFKALFSAATVHNKHNQVATLPKQRRFEQPWLGIEIMIISASGKQG